MLQGRVGGGSPTSANGEAVSNASSLPGLSGTAAGSGIQFTIDGSSPLAATGSAALVSSSAGWPRRARCGECLRRRVGDLHPRGLPDHRLLGIAYVCPCHGSQFDATGRS